MPSAPHIVEDGVIAGNYYDKYGTKNPIARYLMNGFLESVSALVGEVNAANVHEVGCGEGNLSIFLAKRYPQMRFRGSDFSRQVVDLARANAAREGLTIDFRANSLYDLTRDADSADLIICCEVLEHLEDPRRALGIVSKLARKHLILSVPREPIWRVLNMARGKYLKDLGNTPGHLQHWSRRSFLRMVAGYAEVTRILTPLPWTMVLCKVKPG
ncbi:MAG: class I SAM-dependent methyltransferase [Acidobacteriales bacterium]|nr:class I SAM-dependent methyltransferase [Terriglobales bacterium]